MQKWEIERKEKLEDLVLSVHVITYLLVVITFIMDQPRNFSSGTFSIILFVFLIPATMFILLDYFFMKKHNDKFLLAWNITKHVGLFFLITFLILSFEGESLILLGVLYLLPIILSCITLGGRWGLVFAGAAGGSILLISWLLPNITVSQIIEVNLVLSGIFFTVAWFLCSIKKEEEKTFTSLTRLEKEKTIILNALQEAVFYIDTNNRILWINKAAAKVFGAIQEHIVGHFCYEAWFEQEKPCRDCPAIETFETGQPQEATLTTPKGRIYSKRSYPVHNETGDIEGTVVVTYEITERIKMQEEMLKADKLEAVGNLAGGIAHDFNNYLAIILGYTSLIRKKIDKGKEDVISSLSEVEKAALEARNLTQQLLTFSKGGSPLQETASIKNLVKDAATLALSGSKIKYNLFLPDDLWFVTIDKGQINQVINNLVINANQAMPCGGTITIKGENYTYNLESRAILPLEPGKYVKISVQDCGCGIKEEHVNKIFEPYFTTKKDGSGLGLATTYSIIKNHGGYIAVESEVEIGTTFFIYLPISLDNSLPKKATKEELFFGSGKVLVMDDEEQIRSFLYQILTYLGYNVYLSKNGEEALLLYEKKSKSGESFAAVILDLTIRGGMGGKETIKKLKMLDPNVKAIASSGYSEDRIMSEYNKYGFEGFIAKTYTVKDLSKVLNKVINK